MDDYNEFNQFNELYNLYICQDINDGNVFYNYNYIYVRK